MVSGPLEAPPLAPDDMVDEVAGEPFTGLQVASAIAVGVIALLPAGLLPLLLSALAEERRITVSGIGITATVEALSMGLTTGLAGVVLKPRRLKLIAAVMALALAAVDIATSQATGGAVMLARLAAGVPEGLLLWITIALIARTRTPERWAGFLFTGMPLAQVGFAAVMTAVLLPRFGANGGFVALGLASALAAPAGLFLISALGPLPTAADAVTGAPPLRGWVALLATLAFSAALNGVGIFLVPLGLEAGLKEGLARSAITLSLAAQIAGGAAATALAGHVRHMVVFWLAAAVILAGWVIYALHPPAWAFLGAAAAAGICGNMAGPFLVPMTIEADPSRRAAVQSGAVQLLAGALGPFLASAVVRGAQVSAVLALGAVLLLAGLGVMTALHLATPRLSASDGSA